MYSACMFDKIHLKCYAIVLHFLSFSLFFHFSSLFLNTQNFPLKNGSFEYTLDRTVDRNFANVILNIVEQKGIIWKTRSKTVQQSKRQWQIVLRKLQNKPLTFSFLLRGDNRKYNPHSRVPFSNFGVLKNFTPGGPLSSITRIGTWTLWRSSLINLLKIILISAKKNVFISKNLCRFFYRENSTDATKLSKEELETGNWERVYSDNLN